MSIKIESAEYYENINAGHITGVAVEWSEQKRTVEQRYFFIIDVTEKHLKILKADGKVTRTVVVNLKRDPEYAIKIRAKAVYTRDTVKAFTLEFLGDAFWGVFTEHMMDHFIPEISGEATAA